MSAHVSIESCPRSDENPAHWEEIRSAIILDAEIGEVADDQVEIVVEAEVVWASGTWGHEREEEETQTKTLLVTVCTRESGQFYVDRVEE